MLNEDILNSTAYQTYYAYASSAKEPKRARKFKNPALPKLKTIPVSPKESTKKHAKGKNDVSQTRKPATKPKPTKKKAPVKADRGKGLKVLSAVALSKTAQLKEATKRSKKDFHISHASGSGDETNFESGVPNEQQRKISGTHEGTGTKLGGSDIPKYDSKSEKESWGNSREEYDDDEDDSEDKYDDDKDNDDYNDDEDKNNDNDEDNIDRTESNRSKTHVLNQSNKEHEEEENINERVHNPEDYELTDEEDNANNAKEKNEDEKDDEEELYRDVNVNLRKEDVEMTEADQSGADQQNVSQESGFEQEEEDAHVTLTTVHDTQKTKGPMQSSFVSSDFTDKLLNFENTSLANNVIASLMDTTVHHEEPSNRYIDNKQGEAIQQAIKSHTAECREEALADRKEYIDLIDTSGNVTESLEADVLVKSSSKPKSTYEADASLSEFELMKILMDKMEEHKSYLRVNYKREFYDALVRSYNIDKDLFETYGEVFMLKRNRDDKDKDQDPSAGSDREKKIRKSSKDVESSRDPKSKEFKSTSSSKGTSRSQHKSSVTSLKIMKWYDYGHLDKIEVRREDQQLYKFKEVQQKLTNLTINERYDLNVALCMFTRRIVNQRRVEDLQVRVKSYQKKLNLTKPDTFRLDLRKSIAYTAYSDPQGVIYTDQNNICRLMRINELHKFSDGTLNHVRTALHDITSGIRMEYLCRSQP
ncbi:hypothetical protein Tco_1292801 [Tanacetum coccineum]